MKLSKLLVFDVSGEYGHFRKFNTTSSPLTFPIPPRSALAGMLGAILGIERELAPGTFPPGAQPVNELFHSEKAKFAIQILKPVKKVNIGFNLLNTKSPTSFFNIENRTQIEFELLKNPKFRILLHHNEEKIFKELSDRIKNVRHHFTPYLGLSQFTAILEWVDEIDAIPVENNKKAYVKISSAINLTKLKNKQPIQFKNGFYSTETIPMNMTRDRVITEYAEILLEKKGDLIIAKPDKYWQTPYGNILFL